MGNAMPEAWAHSGLALAALHALDAVAWGWVGLRTAIAVANAISWPVLGAAHGPCTGQVSVLIPARNEAATLPALLAALKTLQGPLHEVLVLDDHSTDGTAGVAALHGAGLPLRVLPGAPLPAGWLGKNWACHQLGQVATGTHLLFLDADVLPAPAALLAALGYMERHKLALLSLFPGQVLGTLGERVAVPLMHWILLGLLPLRLVQAAPQASFAAANGQFMLFDGESYRTHHWHAAARAAITEDIEIMRTLKQAGLRGAVLCAGRQVQCRMYGSYKEAVAGFGKNMAGGFGGAAGQGIVLLVSVLGVGRLLCGPWWWLALGLLAGQRVAISSVAGQNVLLNLLLHPAQLAAFAHIGLVSAYQRITKTQTWKGRNVSRA